MVGKTKTEAANHLRAWREHAKLTQQQLAEKVGSKASVISELESGKIQLSAKWLRVLAPHLGTTPGFLLDHAPDELDTAFLRAALDVHQDDRQQATVILNSFRKKAAR